MPRQDETTVINDNDIDYGSSLDFGDDTDNDLNIVEHPYLANMITAIHIHISSLSTDSKISAFSDLINKLEAADYTTNDTSHVGKDIQLRKMVSKIVTEWGQSKDFILKKNEQRDINGGIVPKFSAKEVIEDQGGLLNFNNDAKSSKKFINDFLAKYGQILSNQLKNTILRDKTGTTALRQDIKLMANQLDNKTKSHGFSDGDKKGLVETLTSIKKDIGQIRNQFDEMDKNIKVYSDDGDSTVYSKALGEHTAFTDKVTPIKEKFTTVELNIDLCILDIKDNKPDSEVIKKLNKVCQGSKSCIEKIEKSGESNVFSKVIDGIKNAIKYIGNAITGHGKETTKNAKEVSNAIRDSSLTEQTNDITENHSFK